MATRGARLVGAGVLTCWQRALVAILAAQQAVDGLTHEEALLFLLGWPNADETLN